MGTTFARVQGFMYRFERAGIRVLLWIVLYLLIHGCGPKVEIPRPALNAMPQRVAEYLDEYRTRVKTNPTSGAAWGAYGEALDAHLLLVAARKAYSEARRLEPDEFRWAYNAACVADLAGAPAAELVPLFESAKTLRADYAPLLARYGDALLRQGLAEQASTAYSEALALDIELGPAHRGLGRALFEQARTQDAVTALEAAARAMPDDRATQVLLAQVYAAAGDKEAGRLASNRANELSNDAGLVDPLRYSVESAGMSRLARTRRAEEYLATGRISEAAELLEELVAEEGGNDVRLLVRLGTALATTGDLRGGSERFQRALEIKPGHAGALAGLGQIAEARGDSLEARRQWREAVSAAPRNASLRLGYALVLGRAGEPAAARRELEAALAIDPERADVLHNLGTACLHLEDIGSAEKHLRSALAIDGANPDTHFNLGVALEAMGRGAEALAAYRRTLQLAPGHPSAQERVRLLEASR